jgi:MoaA/NifB/PqqE/SkfB family radical SAM enzyme
LTNQCTLECEHCFTWGSPWQTGTVPPQMILRLLREAQEAGTVDWISVEGGEPFLYYPVMLAAALVRRYALPHAERCADACHLCFEACAALRGRVPRIMAPDQMYGDASG